MHGVRSVELPWISRNTTLSTSLRVPTLKLFQPSVFAFLWSLHYIDMNWLNQWPLVMELKLQALCPPQKLGNWDWKFPPSSHLISSPGNSSHPEVLPSSHPTKVAKDILIVLPTREIPRVLWTQYQKLGYDHIHTSHKSQSHSIVGAMQGFDKSSILLRFSIISVAKQGSMEGWI